MQIINAVFNGYRACNARAIIAKFGDKFELTGALILAAHEARLLNADWLAAKILSTSAWTEYKHVQVSALAEYRRVKGLALDDCERDIYERDIIAADTEYDRIKASALALAEYERVIALALAEIFDRQQAGTKVKE